MVIYIYGGGRWEGKRDREGENKGKTIQLLVAEKMDSIGVEPDSDKYHFFSHAQILDFI